MSRNKFFALFLGFLMLFSVSFYAASETEARSKKHAKKSKKVKQKKASVQRSFIPSTKRPYINLGITIPDLGIDEGLGYKRIRATGARTTRVIIFWNRVAPTKPKNPYNPEDPAYDWSVFDPQVRNALKAGLTPMVQIHQAPAWAERCSIPGEPGICNPDPDEFERFAMAAVRRYNGFSPPYLRVRYWQPWNEPNLHVFFKPQKINETPVSPVLYRDLLDRLAKVVKMSDPKNIVVGGGLAPLGGKNSVGPLEFTRQVLCMEGKIRPKPIAGCSYVAPFDIWAINPYTTGGPTRNATSSDDVQLGDSVEMVRLIDAAKKAGKIKSVYRRVPVWITEFSWDSKPQDPNGLPFPILDRWVSEAIYRSWNAGIETFHWFSLRDWQLQPGQSHKDNLESGLWSRGADITKDKPKSTLRAFEFPFVAFRNSRGIQVWGRTKAARPGVVTLKYSPDRKNWKTLAKVRTNAYGIFYTQIKTSLGKNYRGYVSAYYGGLYSVPFSLTPVKDFYHYPFG